MAKGLPACPLRLTLRGRRELPVKVENMVADDLLPMRKNESAGQEA